MLFEFWLETKNFVILRDIIIIMGVSLLPTLIYFGWFKGPVGKRREKIRQIVFWSINVCYVLLLIFFITINSELDKWSGRVGEILAETQNTNNLNTETNFIGMENYKNLLESSADSYKEFDSVEFPSYFGDICGELFKLRNNFFIFKLQINMVMRFQHFNFNETPNFYNDYEELGQPLIRKMSDFVSVCNGLGNYSSWMRREVSEKRSLKFQKAIRKTISSLNSDNAKFIHTFDNLQRKIAQKNIFFIIAMVVLIPGVIFSMVANRRFLNSNNQPKKSRLYTTLFLVQVFLSFLTMVALFFIVGLITAGKKGADKVVEGNRLLLTEKKESSSLLPKLGELKEFIQQMKSTDFAREEEDVFDLLNLYGTHNAFEYGSVEETLTFINKAVKCQNMTVQFTPRHCPLKELITCFVIKEKDRNQFYDSLDNCVQSKVFLSWNYFKLHFYMENEEKAIGSLKEKVRPLFLKFREINRKLDVVYQEVEKKLEVFYRLVERLGKLEGSIKESDYSSFITGHISQLGDMFSGGVFTCLEIGLFISLLLVFSQILQILI